MKNIISIGVLFCLALGCEFPMKEENFVEISAVPKSNVQIDLINFPDTLNVMEDITISYDLNVSGGPAIAIFIVIGNNAEYIGYSRQGTFKLSPINALIATKGFLPFEFLVFSTSSTGSMADISQRELLIYSMSRILYYDYTPPLPVNFTKVEEKEGSIFLTWDKYPLPNLRSLKLSRTTINDASSMAVTETFYLSKNATSFQDQSFIGGEVEYQIISENSLGNKSNGLKVRLLADGPKIVEFKEMNMGQLEVKWKKSRFYSNSIGYRLTKEGSTATLFTTANPFDTTAVLSNIQFGNAVKLKLETFSKLSPLNVTTTNSVFRGKRILTPRLINYDKSSDTYYYLNSGYVIRDKSGVRDSSLINLNSDNIHSSSLSSDGSKLCYVSGTTTYIVSTVNLSLVGTYVLPGEFYSAVPFSSYLITATPHFSSSSFINLYDPASGTTLQQSGFSSSTLITSLYPTSNQDYLLGEGSNFCVFKLNNDGSVQSSECVNGHLGIVSRDNNFVTVLDQNIVRRKYTFPNLEFVPGSEETLQFYSNTPFDRTMGLMAKPSFNKLDLIDIETLTLVKSIPTAGTLSPENIKLIGGVIFVNSGAWTYMTKVEL